MFTFILVWLIANLALTLYVVLDEPGIAVEQKTSEAPLALAVIFALFAIPLIAYQAMRSR
jgi:hypothetical protein